MECPPAPTPPHGRAPPPLTSSGQVRGRPSAMPTEAGRGQQCPALRRRAKGWARRGWASRATQDNSGWERLHCGEGDWGSSGTHSWHRQLLLGPAGGPLR